MEKRGSFKDLPDTEQEDFATEVAKHGHKVEDFEVTFVETWDSSNVVKTITRTVMVRPMWSGAPAVEFDGATWVAYIDDALKSGAFS